MALKTTMHFFSDILVNNIQIKDLLFHHSQPITNVGNTAEKGVGVRSEGFQVLHSDKPHKYKFQPGGPEKGWRAAVPEGSRVAAGPQELGQKTKH